ncbi:hypothetical protein J6590_033276 [Homalodisca vitripennis]|nr:hypothetical protein J6590_033276 [Homalodisca vitripennis]
MPLQVNECTNGLVLYNKESRYTRGLSLRLLQGSVRTVRVETKACDTRRSGTFLCVRREFMFPRLCRRSFFTSLCVQATSADGIVLFEFVPQTVNTAFYLDVLKTLNRQFVRVRPEIKEVFKLHHVYASSYTAFIVTNYLRTRNP